MGGFGEHHEAPPPPPPIITAIIMLLLIIPMRGASAQPVAALLCFHRPSSPQAQGHQGQAQHLHQVGVSSIQQVWLMMRFQGSAERTPSPPSERKLLGHLRGLEGVGEGICARLAAEDGRAGGFLGRRGSSGSGGLRLEWAESPCSVSAPSLILTSLFPNYRVSTAPSREGSFPST